MLPIARLGRGTTVIAALLIGLLLTGANPAKKTTPKPPAPKPTNNTPYAAQVSELHKIHGLLARADHDYKGHRVQAMKDIHAAILALHPHHKHNHHHKNPGTVKSGGEKQSVSDAQLRTAIGGLRVVENQLATTINPATNKAVGSIRAAIKQLETALKIR